MNCAKNKKKIIISKKIISKLDKMVCDMSQLNYFMFLKSEYWNIVRNLVFKRDKYKCTKCWSIKNIRAHHLTYKHHFNEHRHLNDLITLCDDCHKNIHNK